MTNLRKIALAAVVLLSVAGARAGAQDYSRLTLIRDDATRNFVRTFLSAAFSRGVPTDPLMSKALEGVAKRADTKAIRDAMSALEKRMTLAGKALGPASTVDEIAAGADALWVGAAEGTLKQMRQVAPRRSIALELGVLTELMAQKVSPKKASKMVLDLMARGATGVQLTALSNDVQGDVAAGLKPEVALDLRGHGIMSLLPSPSSASTLQGRPPR